MLSEKVTRILRARGFPHEQIEFMSEHEAWKIVYDSSAHKSPKQIEICFTGFPGHDKSELIQLAQKSGIRSVTSITKALSFLCVGENPGPSKLASAMGQNVTILNREQFLILLSTGEIPS